MGLSPVGESTSNGTSARAPRVVDQTSHPLTVSFADFQSTPNLVEAGTHSLPAQYPLLAAEAAAAATEDVGGWPEAPFAAAEKAGAPARSVRALMTPP